MKITRDIKNLTQALKNLCAIPYTINDDMAITIHAHTLQIQNELDVRLEELRQKDIKI